MLLAAKRREFTDEKVVKELVNRTLSTIYSTATEGNYEVTISGSGKYNELLTKKLLAEGYTVNAKEGNELHIRWAYPTKEASSHACKARDEANRSNDERVARELATIENAMTDASQRGAYYTEIIFREISPTALNRIIAVIEDAGYKTSIVEDRNRDNHYKFAW